MRISLALPMLSLTAVFLVILALPAGAVNGQTPGYDLEFSEYLQQQAAKVQPSVVAIETRFMRTITENGVQREIGVEGDFATGFIYNRDGIVVTTYSVVEHPPSTYFSVLANAPGHQADYILVRLPNGQSYEAEVVGLDGATSLAVLKMKHIAPEDSIPAPLGDSNNVITGEPIMFLGYNWLTMSRISFDFGVISALRPKFPTIEESTNQYFQVNVPQNGGNQGGPVVNANGQVIAVTTSIAPYSDATEIHFGLPINTLVEVVDAILDQGEMHRPWFGFRLLEMNPQIERAYSIITDKNGDGLITDADRTIFKNETGIDLNECLFVIYVDPDSPVGDAGLREADILLEFNGVPVHNMNELSNQIDRYRVGDNVTLQWMRREYAVWDPYVADITIEYGGQRDEAEED
jgi:serine protease Do